MKSFLRHRLRGRGYDGWALKVRGAGRPIEWTVCTTRAEARQLRDELGWLRTDLEIVKVKITVEAVE